MNKAYIIAASIRQPNAVDKIVLDNFHVDKMLCAIADKNPYS